MRWQDFVGAAAVAATSAVALVAVVAGLLSGRCPRAWWLLDHDPMVRRAYDDRADPDATAKPFVVEWECRRCDRVVGVSEYRPTLRTYAALRLQARRFRQQRRSTG